MDWKRFKFKQNKVYAAVDAEGSLKVEGGRVRICYKPGQRTYLAAARNLVPLDGEEESLVRDAADAPAPKASTGTTAAIARNENEELEVLASLPEGSDPIIVYTDGACRGNPGPAGLGAILLSGSHRKELSEYLGPRGTNNIAELMAVRRALEEIKQRERTVIVHTDSTYVIGVLSRNWKAKANRELILATRKLMKDFADLRFIKVLAHSGVPENERADELGNIAIAKHHGARK